MGALPLGGPAGLDRLLEAVALLRCQCHVILLSHGRAPGGVGRRSQVRNDPAFLDRIVADDCTIIHAYGDLLTKAQWMADKRSGATRWQLAQPSEIQVRVYGNTAVAHNHMNVNGRLRGVPFAGQTWQSSTFVKTQGRWRFVILHFTTIPKP